MWIDIFLITLKISVGKNINFLIIHTYQMNLNPHILTLVSIIGYIIFSIFLEHDVREISEQ